MGALEDFLAKNTKKPSWAMPSGIDVIGVDEIPNQVQQEQAPIQPEAAYSGPRLVSKGPTQEPAPTIDAPSVEEKQVMAQAPSGSPWSDLALAILPALTGGISGASIGGKALYDRQLKRDEFANKLALLAGNRKQKAVEKAQNPQRGRFQQVSVMGPDDKVRINIMDTGTGDVYDPSIEKGLAYHTITDKAADQTAVMAGSRPTLMAPKREGYEVDAIKTGKTKALVDAQEKFVNNIRKDPVFRNAKERISAAKDMSALLEAKEPLGRIVAVPALLTTLIEGKNKMTDQDAIRYRFSPQVQTRFNQLLDNLTGEYNEEQANELKGIISTMAQRAKEEADMVLNSHATSWYESRGVDPTKILAPLREEVGKSFSPPKSAKAAEAKPVVKFSEEKWIVTPNGKRLLRKYGQDDWRVIKEED